jgi:hypothetical protein
LSLQGDTKKQRIDVSSNNLPLDSDIEKVLASDINRIINARDTHGLADNDTALRDKLTGSGSYDRVQGISLNATDMTSDNITDQSFQKKKKN